MSAADAPALAAHNGRRVILGVRPEHLVLGDGAPGLGFDARVEVVEQLGSEILLETRVGAASVTVARVAAESRDRARRSGPPFGAARPSAFLRSRDRAADFGVRRSRMFRACAIPSSSTSAPIFRIELDRASHPAQDLLIESMAVALCAHLLRSYTNAVGVEQRSTASVDVAAVRRAIAYIEDNPDRAISLRELAAAAGLSRFHFSRVFKHHLGMSPARYVERTRIEQAKALIVNAEMSLANIAQAVGFADQSHFSRRFRFHEGRTPATVRARTGEGHFAFELILAYRLSEAPARKSASETARNVQGPHEQKRRGPRPDS